MTADARRKRALGHILLLAAGLLILTAISAGSVHFADAGPARGTHVRVRLQYSPPGGKVGAAIAKLLGRDPASEIHADLRQFKQLVESGEVSTNS